MDRRRKGTAFPCVIYGWEISEFFWPLAPLLGQSQPLLYGQASKGSGIQRRNKAMKRLNFISTALVVLMLAFGGTAFASHEFGNGEVNVNTATKDQLVWFLGQTGVGNASMIADNIIAYRDSNGPFDRLADLKKVKGIDQAALDRISFRAKVTGMTNYDPEVVTPNPRGPMLHGTRK
jgi:competence ComEA-like helix-hairpin-helix protein